MDNDSVEWLICDRVRLLAIRIQYALEQHKIHNCALPEVESLPEHECIFFKRQAE